MRTVAILGAGGWGTALAVHLGHIGHDVRLWARDRSLAEDMTVRRANAIYLPDVTLPPTVRPDSSIERTAKGAELVISAVPSHGVRTVWKAARPFVSRSAIIVSATKGLERETLLRMTQVISQELDDGRPVAVVSGPSFAAEVARQLPTAVSIACVNPEWTALVQSELRGRNFRLYASSDVIGVEIGGALKNIIAIAAGVVEGLGLGHNALAGLVTRGLAEITRLACAVGGRRETLSGLAGLGDLVLTCNGSLSRNRHLGIELAHGRPLAEILAGMKTVAEGVRTTEVALSLGEQSGVELPIAAQMAEVLAGRRTPAAAVEELMLRRQRAEADAG